MKLELASKEKRDQYWGKAADWISQQDWDYYANDRFAAMKGVAEYLANQDGFTLFESYQGRGYEQV